MNESKTQIRKRLIHDAIEQGKCEHCAEVCKNKTRCPLFRPSIAFMNSIVAGLKTKTRNEITN